MCKGEQLIASGNVEVKTNGQAYQVLYQTIIGIDSGEIPLKRFDKLKAIAKGESEIEKGQKLITIGYDKIQSAESLY